MKRVKSDEDYMKITEVDTAAEFKAILKDPAKVQVERWIKEISETFEAGWTLDYDVINPADNFGDYELMFRWEGGRDNLQYEMQEMAYAIHDVVGDSILDMSKYADEGIIVTQVEV